MSKYRCPTCNSVLILFANGDNGPHEDRWTCETCGIEYPHTQFPLPKGYVKDAREAEHSQKRAWQEEDERHALERWNQWAKGGTQ